VLAGLTSILRTCFDVGIMVCVSSSDLAAVDYDGFGTLVIVFHSGGVYAYYGVPYSEYVGLMQADSHGKYFHRNIKDDYPWRKLSG
jgi:KTSC domain